jgi:cytochrome P450
VETLVRWFSGYEAALTNYAHDPGRAELARQVKGDVMAYCRPRLAALADRPDGSVLSEMVRPAGPGSSPPRFDEVIGTIEVAILGGLQEPGHAVANTLLGLLAEPEQAAAMSGAPERLSRAAVHEGLRWMAPFGITQKRTSRDVAVRGVGIPAGAEVGLMAASANRDESRYEHPDRFDLHRKPKPHASFGHGVHFCVGSSIAGEVARILLEELFTRLPGLRLDPDAEPVVHGWATRGVTRLPVVWDT